MKATPVWTAALLLLVSTACKRGEDGHAHDKDAPAEAPHADEGKGEKSGAHADEGHGEKGEEGEHAAEEGRVHVDPSMLRDLRITLVPVEVRPGGEGVTALGELSVNQDAYAEVAAPLPARIVALLVSPGQRVKKGDALARLQAPELGQARGALASAQARARAARAAAERKASLAKERIVAPREAQEAEANAAAAEADLRAAQATLGSLGASAEGPGGTFTLRSPVAGTVLEREGVVGQVAEPTRPLFRVGDVTRLWLTVHAFERDAVRVAVGTQARVSLAALPGKGLSAKVTWVGAHVEKDSRTVPVRLELPNEGGLLKPGMSATAFIPLGEGDMVMAVPAAALQQMGEGWAVFLPTDEAGAFERRAVGRGRSLGGEVEVLTGLEAGDRVVAEGAFLLKAEADKAAGGGEEHGH